MDPNATLELMLQCARNAAQGEDVRRNERELRHAFMDLHEWLSKGGFLPVPWSH